LNYECTDFFQNVRILSQNSVMDMVQDNSTIRVYINGTEIEVTPTGVQYPQKIKDDSFVYKYEHHYFENNTIFILI